MSRELRILVVALVGVVALYFAVGSMLPREWQVESSMQVPAAPARVVPLLGDFDAWRRWATIEGTQRPDTQVVVEGAPGTVGHQLAWRSKANEAVLRLAQVGQGGVEYEFLTRLGADQPLRVQGHGALAVEAQGDGSLVRWRDRCEVAGFTERWFAWFGAQQEAARRFQEASLSRLRTQLEGK